MPVIKIENQATSKLPRNALATIDRILTYVPKEHLRGIEKLRLVNTISDPRLAVNKSSALPGLYHPRQANQNAWIEVALDTLLPPSASFLKGLAPRFSFKGNLAAIIFSLVGQNYYFTMRQSVKKNKLESAVRSYTEGLLRQWGEGEHQLRARLFKPLRPFFERWARELKKKQSQAAIKKSS